MSLHSSTAWVLSTGLSWVFLGAVETNTITIGAGVTQGPHIGPIWKKRGHDGLDIENR